MMNTNYEYLKYNRNFQHLINKFSLDLASLNNIKLSLPDIADNDFENKIVVYKNLSFLKLAIDYFRRYNFFDDIELIIKNNIITSHRLSSITQKVIVRVLEYIINLLRNSSSKFEYDIDYAIIMLGKLGAKELNFNSDIDIFFLFEEEKNNQGSKIEKENIEFFYNKITTKFIEFFSNKNLYQTDFRLRPYGRTSPLVCNDGFYKYLSNNKYFWEKMVYLKSRVMSNNKFFRYNIEKAISDFVTENLDSNNYQLYIDEIVNMRNKMKNSINSFPNKIFVKKESGGILDIELIVTYLYLIYIVSNISKLNIANIKRNTLSILEKLNKYNILTNEEYNNLKLAYIFYKTVQNYYFLIEGVSQTGIDIKSNSISIISDMLGFQDEKNLLNLYYKQRDIIESYIKKYLNLTSQK